MMELQLNTRRHSSDNIFRNFCVRLSKYFQGKQPIIDHGRKGAKSYAAIDRCDFEFVCRINNRTEFFFIIQSVVVVQYIGRTAAIFHIHIHGIFFQFIHSFIAASFEKLTAFQVDYLVSETFNISIHPSIHPCMLGVSVRPSVPTDIHTDTRQVRPTQKVRQKKGLRLLAWFQCVYSLQCEEKKNLIYA